MTSASERARTYDLEGVRLARSGQCAEALEMFAAAARTLERAYGPLFPQIADVRVHMGDCLRDCRQDGSGARLQYLHALSILADTADFTRPSALEAVIGIGSILTSQNRKAAASTWFDYAAGIAQAGNNSRHPRLAEIELARLQQMGFAWASPDAYEQRAEDRLTAVESMHGQDSDQSSSAREQKTALREWMGSQRKLTAVSQIADKVVPVLLLLVPVVLWWRWAPNPRLSKYTPYATVVMILITAIWVLRWWLARRARADRPVTFADDEARKLKEFADMTDGGFWFHSGLALRSRELRRLPEARLVSIDRHLIARQYGKALRGLDEALLAESESTPLLIRRALAYAEMAQADGQPGAADRLASAAAADLGRAGQAGPPGAFADSLAARVRGLRNGTST